MLGAMVAAAATTPTLVVRERPATAAPAVATGDAYASNTALYADPNVAEGVDYARRLRRRGVLDDDLVHNVAIPRTAIIAPHGGGIEIGTSELCLAIAGYHPASLAVTPAGAATYDYWMFEGLRASDNGELHVTATHCDDPYARSLCGGARHVIALHGCTPAQVDLPDGTAAVLVGGLDATLQRYLTEELTSAGIRTIGGADHELINGNASDNIANRTLLGMGAQLEITTPVRTAMFGTNTRAQRRNTTTPAFWAFVSAVRTAIARNEAARPA